MNINNYLLGCGLLLDTTNRNINITLNNFSI